MGSTSKGKCVRTNFHSLLTLCNKKRGSFYKNEPLGMSLLIDMPIVLAYWLFNVIDLILINCCPVRVFVLQTQEHPAGVEPLIWQPIRHPCS